MSRGMAGRGRRRVVHDHLFSTGVVLLLLWMMRDVRAQGRNDLIVQRSRDTGAARFVTGRGGEISVAVPPGRQTATAIDLLEQHGHLFGVRDPATELGAAGVFVDPVLGHGHFDFEQVYKGLPVFSGVLKVHQEGAGRFLAVNGSFHPIPPTLNTVPTLTRDAAIASATGDFGGGQVVVETAELVIVDPGWYGDPPTGPQLAYYVVLRDDVVHRQEAYFVNARNGEILDQWSLNCSLLSREVYDAQSGTSLGVLARSEGDPPVGSPADVDRAYDFLSDYYDYYFRAFGRDSVDDAGLTLVASVNSAAPTCPNAAWSNFFKRGLFCTGLVADDIIAHEFTHGVIQHSARLIYQNQSGQWNESFADVFGELVDLFNGDAGFVGPPGGEPWPTVHPTGPGNDVPNDTRGEVCLSGVSLRVNSPADIVGTYSARAPTTNLGAPLTEAGITGELALAQPRTACPAGTPLSNPAQINGKIAVIDSDGGCTVIAKLTNAQNAGAIAMVLTNVAPGTPSTINGLDNRITIPSLSVSQEEGDMLKAAMAAGSVNVTILKNASGDERRWLMGEDIAIPGSNLVGPVRDMWNPACFFHPGYANSKLNNCGESDEGGVHSGSGVPNHAFALATDGGTYRGYTIEGLGPIKTGAVWYRALTVYLTPAADFEDGYAALNQAALDLVETFPSDPRTGAPSIDMFSAADAESIDQAMRAVELNTAARCGQSDDLLSSAAAPICSSAAFFFVDDFEKGVNGWTVLHVGAAGPPTPYDWVQVSDGLLFGRPGTSWFCADPPIGDCAAQNEAAIHSLMSPDISMPSDVIAPSLAFTHFMESEGGWDGGNVKISVNRGAWQLLPRTACTFNPPNGRLFTASQTSENMMAGEDAWTGAGGQWGTTIIDLSGSAAGGDQIMLRFDFAKDPCNGVTGWYIDDVMLFDCPDCNNDGLADVEQWRYTSVSPVLSNIGVGTPQSHTLVDPPPARGTVSVTLTAHGDFRGLTEYLDVDVNGTVVGRVLEHQASDCRQAPDQETLIVPAEVFNQAVGSGDASIHLVASSAVNPLIDDCNGSTYVTLFVDYAITSADENGNGLLDGCEGDFDGDGDVDLRDAATFTTCFTGPGEAVAGPCSAADLHVDAHVAYDDLLWFVKSLTGPR